MAEVAIEREAMIKFIERLYCKCGRSNIYNDYRNHIAMKNFATAIGGEYYSGNETMAKLDEKIEKNGLSDLLPGRPRQLLITGELGEIIINELYPRISFSAIQVNDFMYEHHDNPKERYYVCKSCCSICKNHTNGCTIHCRTGFCDYINILDKIDVSYFPKRETRISSDLMKKFNAYLTSKKKELPKGLISELRSKGYYRSYFDIMELIFTRFDIGFDDTYNAVAKLFQ